MGWKDAWHDLTHDDGFFPLTTHGQLQVLTEAYRARRDGGKEGLNAWHNERLAEKGHQAFDVPLISWDDDYSVEELEEDLDYAADLFRDIVTEVFGLLGAAMATVVNKIPTDIDDMARPPVELVDAGSVYFPYIRDNQGFGNTTMVECPDILIALEPDYARFREASRLFSHDTGIVQIPNSNKRRDNIFRWNKSQSKNGVWV